MGQIKSLEDRAYEKIKREFDEFIADLKTKSPTEIIEAAYEITYKQNILFLFEEEGAFSDKQSKAVLKTKNALDHIYQEWVEYTETGLDSLKDSVKETLNVRYEHIKTKQQINRESR